MHLFEWKTHQDRKWSAYLHFLETLPSWSLLERQIMVAAPTSHMIRFGPLTFRPVKGKKTNKWIVALVLNDWNETSDLQSNLENLENLENGNKSRGHSYDLSCNHSWPKCSQQSIVPVGQRKIERKIRLRQKLRPPKRSKRIASIATLDIVLSPGFLTIRYLFILSA